MASNATPLSVLMRPARAQQSAPDCLVSRRIEAYDVNLGVLSWEPDFFGRIAISPTKPDSWLLPRITAAQILLVSSVANAYLSLVADRESLALAEATLKNQRDAYNLIKKQYDEGLATELTLRQAQITVETARGDIARLRQQVARDKNALTLLLGTGLPDVPLPNSLKEVEALTDISPGLPSELLLQRPDIMAAEHKLKAANAFIGVARSAFSPAFPDRCVWLGQHPVVRAVQRLQHLEFRSPGRLADF